jgi:hypothetical protein
MGRTSEQVAVEELVEVIAGLDLGIETRTDPGAALVLLGVAGPTSVRVKQLATTGPADARRVTEEASRIGSDPDALWVLVADQISPGARRILNSAGWGWLDRRGHFRLQGRGIHIDTDVAPLRDDVDARPSRQVLDTVAGIDTAAGLLAFADEAHVTIRAVAELTGRSVGATHQALHGLRDEGLVDRRWRPLHRELFWELSKRWAPKRVPLGGRPRPGDHQRTSQLLLGLDDIAGEEGWALTESIAGNLYGAPAPVRGDDPPDFYVPDQRAVRVARQLYGDAQAYSSRQATIAIAPVRWVCSRRVDPAELGAAPAWSEFGLAHPLFVALDLSIDAGRGAEILGSWSPPAPYRRVW